MFYQEFSFWTSLAWANPVSLCQERLCTVPSLFLALIRIPAPVTRFALCSPPAFCALHCLQRGSAPCIISYSPSFTWRCNKDVVATLSRWQQQNEWRPLVMSELKFKVRFHWVWTWPFSVCLSSSPHVSKTSVFSSVFEVSGRGERGSQEGSRTLRFYSRKAEKWQPWNGVW